MVTVKCIPKTAIAKDLATQLVKDAGQSKIIVIASCPHVLMSCTKKHWHKQMAMLRRKISSTLDLNKKEQIQNTITALQQQTFISNKSGQLVQGYDVCFIAPQAATKELTEYAKLYVTVQTVPSELYRLVSWAEGGLEVVVYESRRVFLAKFDKHS
ncbi:MAG: hypothetical protein PVI21_03040 [Candidatus Woesebacteria bacterium]